MMTSETEEELRRQKKAIETFVKTFGGSYQKLDPLDVDFKILDKDNKAIAYAEVRPRVRSIRNAYPLPVPAKKLVKLIDKRLAPVLIWSCDDGIIYAVASKLTGQMNWSKDSDGGELVVYYDKQKALKYVRFS